MPRSKRTTRHLDLECIYCGKAFKAVREDAKTCGPKCRVAFNRELRAERAALDRSRALRNEGKTECADCGTTRDGRTKKCPVCGCTRKRPIK